MNVRILDSLSRLPARRGPGTFATGLIALAGMVILLLMTRWGIGTSPDSVQYIRAARQLLGPGEASLTHHAPFYSFLLAAGGLIGVDPLDGARWLNVLLFGLNIFLVGSIVRGASSHVAWLWAAGSLLTLGSTPVLTVHVTALSEPAFLSLILIGFSLLAAHLESPKRGALVAAGVAIGLAFLTRYAGLAGILTGALALLLLNPRPLDRRINDTLLFGFVASFPMLAWMIRNLTVASTATGREFAFHPINASHVWQALYTVSSWMLIPAWAPNAVRLALGMALAAGLAAVLLRAGRAAASMPPIVRVLALFIAIYGAFLVVSISFFDANTPLDDRILVPVFAAGLIVVLLVIDRLWPLARKRPALAYLVVTLLIAFVGGHMARGAWGISASYARGWGFSSRAWQQSATLEEIRRMPEGMLIYSAAPEIIYLHTGRTARPIPKLWLPMNQEPNRDFPAQLRDTRQRLEAECGVVVYFRNLAEQKSVPSQQALKTQLSLRVLAEKDDGSILSASTCRQ